MVIETSALAAILFGEPERLEFLQKMARVKRRLLSAASLVELSIVLNRNGKPDLERELDAFLFRADILTVPVDHNQAVLAREADRRFGRGRHPAGLNFGDCFSYALAMQTGDALLFKGNDFSLTDVKKA